MLLHIVYSFCETGKFIKKAFSLHLPWTKKRIKGFVTDK
jgi:hypothetical protein